MNTKKDGFFIFLVNEKHAYKIKKLISNILTKPPSFIAFIPLPDAKTFYPEIKLDLGCVPFLKKVELYDAKLRKGNKKIKLSL